MSIFQRAKDIILNPRVTWQIVKDETSSNKDLFINYAAPLALIPTICSLIGLTLIGVKLGDGGVIRAPLIEAITAAVAGYLLNLAMIFVAAWLVTKLAPLFQAKSDLNAALKVIIYSMTPVWLVGVFSLIPGLGVLSILGLYGVYLLALGLGTVLETAGGKIIWFVLSILVLGFVLTLAVSVISVGLFYGPMFMRLMTA